MLTWQTFVLFILTAIAEIAGCYLFWLVWRLDKTGWLLLPSAAVLLLFAWLLCLHPTAAGRTFAAYGGVYVAAALLWAVAVEGMQPVWRDYVGVALCLCGAAVIASGVRA